MRTLLSEYVNEHAEVFQLNYHGNDRELLAFDILAELIGNYRRHLSKWPDFLDNNNAFMNRDMWLGFYCLHQFIHYKDSNHDYEYGWCTTEMSMYAIQFYIHIILLRENIDAQTCNNFTFDEIWIAYLIAFQYDIGIHVWKQNQSALSNITYEHYDFIHRNTHQGADRFYPTMNILYVSPKQKLGKKTVYTCPQFRLLMHNGNVFEQVNPADYSLMCNKVAPWIKPSIPPYRRWALLQDNIPDLYNCILMEFGEDTPEFKAFELKCLKHFCKRQHQPMSYFDAYEDKWKLIHALWFGFPYIGLYGKYGLPEPNF